MHKVAKLGTTMLLSIGLTAAAFVGIASAGEQLNKKEYLEQGNAICRDANDELDALGEEAFAGLDENEEPSVEAQAAFVAGVVPIVRQVLDDLDALEGPSKLDKKVAKLIDQYAAVLDEVEADPSAAIGKYEDPFAKPLRQAKKLGLRECR